MAEKLRDTDDRMLEAMFRSEPVADDGFSDRIVSRIRRGIWVRRLALPVAALVGGGIAIKPLSQLVTAATHVVMAVPQDLLNIPADWVPHTQMLMFGAILFAAGMIGLRMIED